MLGAQLIRHTSLADSVLAARIKTATDVLRVAVALSDGDVSLAEPAKFTNFKRRERKWLLACLEQCGSPMEDMLRWPEPWKRLGERLHPGDYAAQFPKSYTAFDVLRNDKPCITFNSRIEHSLCHREFAAALNLLKDRPGDLTRRLDHLLRLGGDINLVIETFGILADRVSTPVLLQAMTHFKNRVPAPHLRSFFPKGDVAKVYATSKPLPELSVDVAMAVAHL